MNWQRPRAAAWEGAVLDWNVFSFINGLAGRWPLLDAFGRLFAEYGVLLYVVPALAAWYWPPRIWRPDGRGPTAWADVRATARADVARAVVTALLAMGVNQVIGFAWARPRPFVDHQVHILVPRVNDASFPSDHSTVAWSVVGSLGHLPSWARWFDVIVAVVLMLARVFVGVHYPLDVLGGAAVGLVMSAIVRWAWRFVPRGFDRWLTRLP